MTVHLHVTATIATIRHSVADRRVRLRVRAMFGTTRRSSVTDRRIHLRRVRRATRCDIDRRRSIRHVTDRRVRIRSRLVAVTSDIVRRVLRRHATVIRVTGKSS